MWLLQFLELMRNVFWLDPSFWCSSKLTAAGEAGLSVAELSAVAGWLGLKNPWGREHMTPLLVQACIAVAARGGAAETPST